MLFKIVTPVSITLKNNEFMEKALNSIIYYSRNLDINSVKYYYPWVPTL